MMIRITYKYGIIILQMQIIDYFHGKKIENYDMSIPRDYLIATKKFKWLPKLKTKRKKNKFKNAAYYKSQKRISDYLIPKLPFGKTIYRFRHVEKVTYDEFAKDYISQKEWDFLQMANGYNGIFEYLFIFNDFSFFDDLQVELEEKGVSFKGIFVRDIIFFELLRLNMGLRSYRDIEKVVNLTGMNPLLLVNHNKTYFPTAADISYVLKRIPAEAIYKFFMKLVDECIKYGIIKPRILIWDGQFIRSKSSNNKKKGSSTYSDKDAGYCRHNGTKKGVGYDPGILYAYCKARCYPVYFKMFAGNRSDSEAMLETLKAFQKDNKYKWYLFLSDSGPYSKKNLEAIRNLGIIPLVRARKNIKNQQVIEVKKGYYFNTEYFPKGWSKEYISWLYNARPMIEQGNSYNITYYNGTKMNTRGLESAVKYRSMIYILMLLKALTSYKLGRTDLMMKAGVYEMSYLYRIRDKIWCAVKKEVLKPLEEMKGILRED